MGILGQMQDMHPHGLRDENPLKSHNMVLTPTMYTSITSYVTLPKVCPHYFQDGNITATARLSFLPTCSAPHLYIHQGSPDC